MLLLLSWLQVMKVVPWWHMWLQKIQRGNGCKRVELFQLIALLQCSLLPILHLLLCTCYLLGSSL